MQTLNYLSPYEVMFGQKNRLSLVYSIQEREVIGFPDLWARWEKQKAEIDRIVTIWTKKRDQKNRKKYQTKQKTYTQGTYVVVRDKQIGAKGKTESRQFRIPLEVHADLGAAVLCKDYQSRIRYFHKNNLTECVTGDREKFEGLPH